MGDFQNPEMPLHFAEYAGAVAERYPWVRGVHAGQRDLRLGPQQRVGRAVERAAAHRARLRDGAEAPRGRQPARRAPRSSGTVPTPSSCRARSAEYTHHVVRGAVARREAAQQADLPLARPAVLQVAGRRRADVRAGQRHDPRGVHVVHAHSASGLPGDGQRLLRPQREARCCPTAR